jgi:hypothetical protein
MSLTASPTTSSAKPSGALDAFCPCTINGHECEAEDCDKMKICIVRSIYSYVARLARTNTSLRNLITIARV